MSDYKIGDTPGYEGPRPYRPANGTEGQIFMEQFCFQCLYESKESPCPIISQTMMLDDDDPKYPNQWRYDEKGIPVCIAFRAQDNPEPIGDHCPRCGRSWGEPDKG